MTYFWVYHLVFTGGRTKTGLFSTKTDFLKGDTEENCLNVCMSLCKGKPKLFKHLKKYFFRSISHGMILEAAKDIEKCSGDRPGNDWPGT